MKYLEINNEVFFAKDLVVKIGSEDVSFLKEKALISQNKRARICAHKTNNDDLHEMLIAISKQSYIQPHKHLGKSESFHIIEGIVDVVLFEETGKIKQVVELGDMSTQRCFFYRTPENIYHMPLIKSDVLVMHEVTGGPFERDDTVYASWAPVQNDLIISNKYRQQLLNHVNAWKRDNND